jgi:cytoskeletal protein CcmA (bactofilin family)
MIFGCAICWISDSNLDVIACSVKWENFPSRAGCVSSRQGSSSIVGAHSEAPASWETLCMWKRDQSVAPSTGHDQTSEAAPADRKPSDNLVMNLGKSVIIKGELSGSEDLTLYGQMEGSVKLPDYTLTIGPHADIRAQISAKTVIIMGDVTGNVSAVEKVEIRSTGSVLGDVASPRLAIADGGCLRGKVATSRSSG